MEGGGDSGGDVERKTYRIGCALLPKKESRYLTSNILELALKNGVDLCVVDPQKPLSQQGHFDAIIHKRQMDTQWESNLREYAAANPSLKVIDRVDGIRLLANRSTMLSIFDKKNGILIHKPSHSRTNSGDMLDQPSVDTPLDCTPLKLNLNSIKDSPKRGRAPSPPPGLMNMQSNSVRVLVPRQLTVETGARLNEVEDEMAGLGMGYPLVVKSQWADGREGSHLLAVVHDRVALEKLLDGGPNLNGVEPPFVVQQYVEHGGVLYKVYVVGSRTMCCQRPSLNLRDKKGSGIKLLPRISCQRRCNSDDDLQQPKCSPPEWVTTQLANSLRKRLGLQLFNFDLIQPEGSQDVYYVVDINYFPGVDKIRDFEHIFVDFLLSACKDGN